MRKVLAPLALSALAALAGCKGLGGRTTEDETRLSAYLERAAAYYDQGHFERAYQQWDKALDLEVDNVKGRLGQAMALYQLGKATTPEGLARLAQAEIRLNELRVEDLDGQEWKAELGYGMVQERWVQLYAQKVRILEAQAANDPKSVSPQDIARHEAEVLERIKLAEDSFNVILNGEEQARVDRLTCILSMSRLAAYRRDWERSQAYADEYEEQIRLSKDLWKRSIEADPQNTKIWEAKLAGAERQEAELRDIRAAVYFKTGRLEEALAELEQLLLLQPDRAGALLNRGIVREAMGDWDRAKADFERFIEVSDLPDGDPTLVEAGEHLRRVKDLVAAEDAERLRLDSR